MFLNLLIVLLLFLPSTIGSKGAYASGNSANISFCDK